MKKFLTGILACLLAAVGVFTLCGCEKERDFNGFYRLDYAIYASGSDTVEYKYDLDSTETEIYIQVDNTTITEYTFVKNSGSNNKVLLKKQIWDTLTQPEFQVTKEGKTEYFTNYTNLGRYVEGINNPYKLERWTYVQAPNLPVIAQQALSSLFGKYVVDKHGNSNLVVSNINDCSLILNGSLIIKDGNKETTYRYIPNASDIYYTFENNGTRIQLEIVHGDKLKVYWQEGANSSESYIEWKLETALKDLDV